MFIYIKQLITRFIFLVLIISIFLLKSLSIKISLYTTAGDAVENFDILKNKIANDNNYLSKFHLIFCCLRVIKENQCIDDLNKLESKDFVADGDGSRDTISKLINSAILHNCIFGLNKNLDQLPIKLISIVDLEVKKLY